MSELLKRKVIAALDIMFFGPDLAEEWTMQDFLTPSEYEVFLDYFFTIVLGGKGSGEEETE